MKKILSSVLIIGTLTFAGPSYAAENGLEGVWQSLVVPLENLVESLTTFLGFSDDVQVAQLASASAIAEERSLGKAFGPFGETVTPPNGRGVFEGELVIGVADDFENGTSEHFYYLHDKVTDIVLRLKPEGELPPGLEAGALIKAVGRVKNGEMEVATDAVAGEEGSVQLLEEAEAGFSGGTQTRTVAAVLINWTDVANPCTTSQITNNLFGETNSVKKAYESASHGEISFTGDVFGPYTINYASTDGLQDGWWPAIQAAAAADGVDINAYDHQTIFMPKPLTSSWGFGWYDSGLSYIMKCDSRDTVQHEIGHNLNLGHAGQGTNQYSDTSSFMGYAGYGLRHTHAGHMDALNWLPDAAVIDSPAPGTYTISSSDAYPGDSVFPQALRIPKSDTNEYYYVSYRAPIGYAGNMPSQYDNHAQVHKTGVNSRTYTTLVKTFADGSTFTDAANGITITQRSSVPGVSATIEVSTNCTTVAPSVTINPREIGSQAGGTADYVATVRNNNGSYCGTANIELSSSDSSDNLTTSLSQSSVSLASGASTNINLTATADANIAGGSQTISVTAESGGRTGSANAYFTIDDTPPSAPSNVVAESHRKQVNVTWNSSTDNISVVGYKVYRDGAEIGTTQTTSFADKFPTSGLNTYQITALDAAGNESTFSNAASAEFNSNGGGKGGGKNGGGDSDSGDTGGSSGKPEKCSPWPQCK